MVLRSRFIHGFVSVAAQIRAVTASFPTHLYANSLKRGKSHRIYCKRFLGLFAAPGGKFL